MDYCLEWNTRRRIKPSYRAGLFSQVGEAAFWQEKGRQILHEKGRQILHVNAKLGKTAWFENKMIPEATCERLQVNTVCTISLFTPTQVNRE